MTSDKHNPNMVNAMGLISSYTVQCWTFCQSQQLQYIHDGFPIIIFLIDFRSVGKVPTATAHTHKNYNEYYTINYSITTIIYLTTA